MVSPSTFGLCADVPDDTLDPEWHALVAQQAHTLAALLHRLQATVAGAQRADAARLQVLAADTRRCLAAQAQQHVRLERELGQLRAMVTNLDQAPAEMTQRVQRLERVIEVLHANLTAARGTIATLTQAQA